MKRIEDALPLFRETPLPLIWGMQDPVLPPAVLRRWQRLYPQARTYEIEDASHFLQEDAHQRMVPWFEEFLQTTT
jgi:pimeloyl-ACP methyl ester carboxylesterase